MPVVKYNEILDTVWTNCIFINFTLHRKKRPFWPRFEAMRAKIFPHVMLMKIYVIKYNQSFKGMNCREIVYYLYALLWYVRILNQIIEQEDSTSWYMYVLYIIYFYQMIYYSNSKHFFIRLNTRARNLII